MYEPRSLGSPLTSVSLPAPPWRSCHAGHPSNRSTPGPPLSTSPPPARQSVPLVGKAPSRRRHPRRSLGRRRYRLGHKYGRTEGKILLNRRASRAKQAILAFSGNLQTISPRGDRLIAHELFQMALYVPLRGAPGEGLSKAGPHGVGQSLPSPFDRATVRARLSAPTGTHWPP